VKLPLPKDVQAALLAARAGSSVGHKTSACESLTVCWLCCAGVPDVFRSPLQTCPLDLDTDAFYPARRAQLDAQLTRIADGQAGESVCQAQAGSTLLHAGSCRRWLASLVLLVTVGRV
jgi:hypothetical protein